MLDPTTERILDYLFWAKSQEQDPWMQDDLHISFLTVLWAGRGYAHPNVLATQLTLGITPDKVWPAIIAQRHAKLGPLYDSFYPQLPQKKPSASVTSVGQRKQASRQRPAER